MPAVSKEVTHTNNSGDNEEQKAKRYYYHSDHLGSVQFVTDWKGRQYEHIEYTPYGELWTYKSKTAMLFLTTYNNFLAKQPAGLIEEVAAGLDKLPFRFTGKELDEETGLYYYVARYLDPKYSRWLSGDPALGEYIPQAPIDDEAKKHNENLPGLGGVYNTVNLHVYHYAGYSQRSFELYNPVKYTDPDGRSSNNGWTEIKNAITPAINFDFGADYYNLSVQKYNNGDYFKGFLYSVDFLCEAAYDSLIVYTGVKLVGGLIKSTLGILTSTTAGLGEAEIDSALSSAERVQHAARHLIDSGILPKWNNSTKEIAMSLYKTILSEPSYIFDSVLKGGESVRGYT